MRLRGKLLLPIILAFFVGFAASSSFLSIDQSRKKLSELASYSENLTSLAATSNSAYLWNLDTQGLTQSLESFRKIREIVGIEIQDAKGTSVVKLEADKKPGSLMVRKAAIQHEGQSIGNAILTFTDPSPAGK